MYPGIDMKKFKGFAIRNRSEKDIAIRVDNESSFPKEFILKSGDVYYALVADVVSIEPLGWAKKSEFKVR